MLRKIFQGLPEDRHINMPYATAMLVFVLCACFLAVRKHAIDKEKRTFFQTYAAQEVRINDRE